MPDLPGCDLWLVQCDLDDPDMIRVPETWASRQHCDAAVNLPRDAVRIGAASAREPEAGRDGLEVLAFGSHSPGDGDLVADWWTT
jgi:hypothetical protein